MIEDCSSPLSSPLSPNDIDKDEVDKKSQSYCRKEKSLQLLCDRFLHLIGEVPRDGLCLDEIAQQLQVERRRMYDIVHVLESLLLLYRTERNRYRWLGYSAISGALKSLMTLGSKDTGNIKDSLSKVKKSLSPLTQGFVCLFLQAKENTVFFIDAIAARLLPISEEESESSGLRKTKVRRLYDIANVLVSLGLLNRYSPPACPPNRRPGLVWTGIRPLFSQDELLSSFASSKTCAAGLPPISFSQPKKHRGAKRRAEESASFNKEAKRAPSSTLSAASAGINLLVQAAFAFEAPQYEESTAISSCASEVSKVSSSLPGLRSIIPEANWGSCRMDVRFMAPLSTICEVEMNF